MDCRVPILMYHRITDAGPPELAPFRVSPAAFRAQIRLLRERGYYPIPVAELTFSIITRRFIPGKPVIITFDDGYKDFLENAWPILQPSGFFATIFVVTSRVGGVADWDQSGVPLLDWDELRALQAYGNTIASHCHIHRDLTRRTDEAIATDAEQARGALRRELGIEANAVAFPWGKSDARVRRALARSGYAAGLGIAGRASSLFEDPLDLPRIEIFGGDDLACFEQKLAAAPPGDEPFQLLTADGFSDFDRLAARIDRLVAELRSIRRALLDRSRNPPPLAATLDALFAQPAGGPLRLTPNQWISPWTRLGFEGGADVEFAVMAHARNRTEDFPFPQFLRLSFDGSSRWFSLDLILADRELDGVRRFQLALSLRASRPIDCRAALRLWQKDRQYRENELVAFAARPGEQDYNFSGEIVLPDPLMIDHNCDPIFLLLFDTREAFEVDVHYLNIYFA